MTGTEISTAVRLGLIPIIFILNNEGYGTMRKLHDGKFNVITQWNYHRICQLVGGGESAVASTKGELDEAIRRAQDSGKLTVIEIKIPRDDISPQLATIGREVARVRGWKTPGNDRKKTEVNLPARSTRGVFCATRQLMRKRAAILFTVALAMFITPLALPAASCILSNAPRHEACKSNCCANRTCCATSQKNTGPSSQPLAQSANAKQDFAVLAATLPITSPPRSFLLKRVARVGDPVRAHSPPLLSALCIQLI
jgi:hypothetical protein